jgi:SMP-30/Gluconolactonase/LRE-like region
MIATRPTIVVILVVALSSCSGEGGATASGSEGITISDVGFSTPEAVLHDSVADVYLVSNIEGSPVEADGNGFISRVSPEGEVVDLRWIDGATEGVELNAPKGMEILGDSLYVADIDCVRIFVRTTGAPAGQICIRGAMFLNDIAVDDNGTLYVTDTGLAVGPDGLGPTENSAIFRFFPTGESTRIAAGEELGNPNGIAVGSRGVFVVTFGSGEVYQFSTNDGTRTHVLDDPQLDGIAFTEDGGFLYSSWGASAVYEVTPTGQKVTAVEGVDAPASIGYDASRRRVLIPLFNLNEVWIRDVPGNGA